jgi:hypothetical protein
MFVNCKQIVVITLNKTSIGNLNLYIILSVAKLTTINVATRQVRNSL